MSRKDAISYAQHQFIYGRLEDAYNRDASPKQLIVTARFWITLNFLLRVFLGVVTLGVLPLLYRRHIKKINEETDDNRSLNYFTVAYNQTKKTLTDLKAIKHIQKTTNATTYEELDESNETSNSDEDSELEDIPERNIRFEYEDGKFATCDNHEDKFRIRFGQDADRVINFPHHYDMTRIIPVHFEFSDNNFQFNWLEIYRGRMDKTYLNVLCRGYHAWAGWEPQKGIDPLKTDEIPNLIRAANFEDVQTQEDRGYEAKHKFIFRADDNLTKSEIMAMTYHEPTSSIYIATHDNNLYKVPVIKNKSNMFERNNDAEIQHTEIPGETYIVDLRVDDKNRFCFKRFGSDDISKYDIDKIFKRKEFNSELSSEETSKNSSNLSESDDVDHEEELKRLRDNFGHPLGPLYGCRYVPEEEEDKQTTYDDERSAATILNNGNIVACDPIHYKHGHTNYAIGVFDTQKNLVKPLCRWGNPRIENMVALEYAPDKFAYFYRSLRTVYIEYNNGRDGITLPYEGEKKATLIPLKLDITDKKFNAAYLIVTNEGVSSAAYSIIATGGASLESKKIQRIIDDASHRVSHEKIELIAKENISAATYHEATSTLFVATSDDTLICVSVEKFGENGLLNPNNDPIEIKTEPSDHAITHIAVGENRQIIALARKDGSIELYKRDNNNILKKLSETFTLPKGGDGEILDLKFVDNGDLVIACSKKTLTISKDNIQSLHDAASKESNDKDSYKELRKSRKKSADDAVRYNVEKESERKTSYILKNGDIFACDKVTFDDNSSKYRLGIYHSKYELSAVTPIIKEMIKGKQMFTPDTVAKKFIPYRYNDEFAFLANIGDSVKIYKTDGTIADFLIPPKLDNSKSHSFILVDSEDKDQPSVIATDGVHFYHFRDDIHWSDFLDKKTESYFDIHATTYNEANESIYFVHDNNFLSRTDITTSKRSSVENNDELLDVIKIAVSENGNYLAAAKTDGTITLFDIKAFNNGSDDIKKLTDFKIDGCGVLDLRFVDEDRDLLIATDNRRQPAVRITNFEEKLEDRISYHL